MSGFSGSGGGGTKTIAHSWTIPSEAKVQGGDTNYITPMFVVAPEGQTVKLIGVSYRINAGTSVLFKLQNTGTDISGFTALTATTTAASTTGSVTLAHGDLIAPVITTPSGNPKGTTITGWFQYS